MTSAIADDFERDARKCFDRAEAAEKCGKTDCAANARESGQEFMALAQARRRHGIVADGRRNPC